MSFSRIIVSALSGGSGKTLVTIGIIGALRQRGKLIAPYKKGPDYIDAGWLTEAANSVCYNLDTFMCSPNQVIQSFLFNSQNKDISVIEGNRGLYDGIDIQDSTSTAELAKLLKIPVILCLDCTKITRTMAALVLGCINFDKDVQIKGIILNKVAGSRHEAILRKSIENYCSVKVLGAIPKIKNQNFPERHMGLVPIFEHKLVSSAINYASGIIKNNVDLDTLQNIANQAITLKDIYNTQDNRVEINITSHKALIGVIKDSAFQFYYPDNIIFLEQEGAKIVFISPIDSNISQNINNLNNLDGLYIGGGFPETHADILAKNIEFKNKLKTLAHQGLPIYAECGGLMYLGRELLLNNKSYAMVDLFPISFDLSKKPQGHGYTICKVIKQNPYFEIGTEIKGHEFHYSRVHNWDFEQEINQENLVFSMQRGVGICDNKDGLCYKNTLATYTHIHALGNNHWGKSLINNALIYKKFKNNL